MNKKNPESLENCLTNLKKSWSDFDKLFELSKNWRDIVGEDLAKECKPIKIENDVLTIGANHPEWRQALTYNKHNLKEEINKSGIKLKNIRIIQNYSDNNLNKKSSSIKTLWDKHPSRIKNNNIINCKYCNLPTPKGEIERWGKCTFCWRKRI